MSKCKCGDQEERHGPNAAGPHRGACLARLCGCLYFRPDLRVGDEAEAWLAARNDAPTGTEG